MKLSGLLPNADEWDAESEPLRAAQETRTHSMTTTLVTTAAVRNGLRDSPGGSLLVLALAI